MTVKLTAQELLAVSVANNVVTAGNATQAIDKDCQALRKARKNKPLGLASKGDACMVRFIEVLQKAGKAEQTVKNLATAFRNAVNKGVPFSMNAYRKTASKGAKQKGSIVPDVKIILSGEPDEATVAKKFREIFNGWKKKEKNLGLVMFLLDGLDEFEGK